MDANQTLGSRLAVAALGDSATKGPSLQTYFNIYHTWIQQENLLSQYYSEPRVCDADILPIITSLRYDPSITREDLRRKSFPTTWQDGLQRRAHDSAIGAAMRLTFMIDCNAGSTYGNTFAIESWRPQSWHETQTLGQYLQHVCEQGAHSHPNLYDITQTQVPLDAYTLLKRLHLEYRPTDSLAEHLLLDWTNSAVPVLYIFHHAAFLKAQLRLSSGSQSTITFEESLRCGYLPRQLISETLMTLQYILFPATDDKSDQILSGLIQKHPNVFDMDCQQRDKHTDLVSSELVQPVYWAKRMAILAEAVKNPRPRGKFMSWVDQRTSDRNALYVALLGLFLAVLFGFLGVVIGIIQTIISYKAWKYPVSS